jgi:hypothetical protein
VNPLRRLRIPWGLVCAAVLCITLTLGLWPFHGPPNQVAWLPDANGISFGNAGTVLSSGDFFSGEAGVPADSGFSLEIWAQPHPWLRNATLLTFYNPQTTGEMIIAERLDDLDLRSGHPDPPNQWHVAKLLVRGMFRRARPVFITIACGRQGTAIYTDGVLHIISPTVLVPATDFAGRLVLGDSPVQPDSWRGQILGLAIYATELTREQTAHHHATWSAHGRPEIRETEQNLALYLFQERSGSVVHDSAFHNGSASRSMNLYVPERYEVIDKALLEPLWQEFNWSRSYWSAAAKNIVGFVPLGFCFCFWLVTRQTKHAMGWTLIIGFAVSMTIEVLQWFLPTRDSGMSDLITNSIGTGCGILLQPYAAKLLNEWQIRAL